MSTDSPAVHPPAASVQAWLAPLLAGVAGFIDTTGFIVFAGIFLAHITGNFVVLGATLSGQEHGSTAAKLVVLPLFIAGVIGGWLILRSNQLSGPRRIAAAEGLLLIVCGGFGVWSQRAPTAQHTLEMLAIACGVLGMGLQSMLGRSLKLPMTHVMTGNVTQLTVDLLDARFSRAGSMAAARKNIVLVAAFASGAALAGALVATLGLAVLILPAGALLVVAWALK